MSPTAKPEKRVIFTDQRIGIILASIAMLLAAIVAVEAVRLQRGNQTRAVINRIDEVTAIVKDSVDPGGVRFKRGQDQTAAAITSINEVTQLAVYCGQKYTDIPSIQGCVLYEYRKAHPVPVPTTVAK